MLHTQRKEYTTLNANTGVGHQNNNNDAGTQNVAYNGGQVNSFVNSFNAAAPNPHKNLWDKVAGVGASHTSEQQYERGECLQGTRIRALEAVYDWIDSTSSENHSLPICWLSGPAGVGKSAMAMTIAKACEGKRLAASFFFFRSDPRRNNPSALVLTIAQGLVVNTIFTRAVINRRISDDPSILEARLEDQFRELIMKPSLRWRWWKRQLAKLSSAFKEPDFVIIDGLDECGDEPAQRRILSTILSSYQRSPRSPLRFLICSRPEAWIQEAFEAEGLSQISECVVLDDRLEPDRDIERYYLHEFQAICEDRKYARVQFPTPWPSPEVLSHLAKKSSGQFVYAVTTVRFIRLPHSNPIANLEIILNYIPEDSSSQSSLAALDGLYHVILSVNPHRERMLSILAAILILPFYDVPSSPEFIELLFELPAGDVDAILWSLHSILNIQGGDAAISVYHTSFVDFLHDPSRSGEFYIDRAVRHSALACQWLRALARQIKIFPDIILDPGSVPYQHQHISRCLLESWVRFYQTDNQSEEELLVERNNLLQSMLSVIPGREELLTGLASIILLPTYATDLSQSQALHDLILGPSSIEPTVLKRCQLLAPSSKPEPFFLEFLLDPLQEYYIGLSKYRDPIARRWIAALVPKNYPPEDAGWVLKTLWSGWADFCCGIEWPSEELLSDLSHLDLMTVSVSMALMHPGHVSIFSILTTPLEAIISWLSKVDCPVPLKVIEHFKEAVKQQRVGFQEIHKEHQSFQSPSYGLDATYHTILWCANPDHDKTRSILATILLLPAHSRTRPSPATIRLVLGLSSEDMDRTLQLMHTVLNVCNSNDEIHLYHTSFRAYLVDWTRSRNFYINFATEGHAIAQQWLRNLSTNQVQTYDSHQLYGSKTISFYTNWLAFCTQLKPTRDLLEDLWHVDLTSAYILSDSDWESTFEGLVSWVGNYNGNGLPPYSNGQYNYNDAGDQRTCDQRDDRVLVQDLLRKCRRNRRNHFHLIWPPDVSPRSQIMRWMVQKATYCNWKTRLDGSRPNNVDDIRLTNCRCDLSGGIKRNPVVGDLVYQRACMQLVKDFTSTFKFLTWDDVDNATLEELENIFLNVTFPHEYAEEEELLKAQVVAWPRDEWEQNWQKTRPRH
ncbi:hypothetical protein PQX77_014826 [Marasmius sp. AFHP31]|nr:hypothetical protein PQX77_014826 [Marasmius sp. AFHP31]